MCRSPQENIFAVGYADGSVRLWNSAFISVIATFNGHQKSVTALAFDAQGARLASGSQDTDIIVWDVVAEAGLYRYVISSVVRVFSYAFHKFTRPSQSNYNHTIPFRA
jgi:WD40 repeat protein